MPIVRRQSWRAKIASYPFDLYLKLNEQFSTIDWDSYSDEYLIPIGLLLNALFFATRYFQLRKEGFITKYDLEYSDLFDAGKNLPLSRLLRESAASQTESPFLVWLLNIVGLGLAVISFVNAYFLFLGSYRTYSLFIRGSDYVPNTPSAYKEEIDPGLYNKESAPKLLYGHIKSLFFNSSQEEIDPASFVWKLDVWEPSRLQLIILAVFSPLHVLYYYSLKSTSFFSFLYITALSLFLYYLIFSKFLVLLKDRQLILSETLNEYDLKFVKPRLSKRLVDASVDATRGPFVNNTVYFSSPAFHSREFPTYRLKEQHNLASRDKDLLKENIKRRQSYALSERHVMPKRRALFDYDHRESPYSSRKTSFD